MFTRSSLLGLIGMGASTVVWAAGCSSTSTPSNVDAGGSSSSSSGGGSSSSSGSSSGGGGADGQAAMDAGLQDATAEANTLGVLVDNMTAPTGTQNQMGNVDAGGAPIPAGETGGTYYTYLDPYSIGTISSALADVPVTPPVSEPDGSQIVGELCFKGSVTEYAGLGMNIVYQTKAPDASPAAPSAVEPFDASKYSGVSFYIYVYPLDGGQLPQLHFGIPDTQTAGPESWPASTCLDLPDGGDGDCYDDFGSDLIVTPGTWSQQSFAWSELTQGNWGAQYPLGLKTNQLIAMKWQANGPAADSGISELPFDFCISNIYFTP